MVFARNWRFFPTSGAIYARCSPVVGPDSDCTHGLHEGENLSLTQHHRIQDLHTLLHLGQGGGTHRR